MAERTDLVTRLRGRGAISLDGAIPVWARRLCGEAADRIEQLQRELTAAQDYGQMWEDATKRANAAEARIERLEREVAGARREALKEAANACESLVQPDT